MPIISILLPSLREEAVLERIEEFSLTNSNVDYEIIVVGPFTITKERVISIYEAKPEGCYAAMRSAYENSRGEWIVYWSDDASPVEHCLSNMLNFIRKDKWPFIGAFSLKNKQGRHLPQWSVYGKLYASWGCISKDTVNMIGGLFDPVFKSFWGDPDMCLRAFQKDIRVKICPNACALIRQIKDNIKNNNLIAYFNSDMETFLNRWHDRFCKGIKREFSSVNKPMAMSLFMRMLSNQVISG